MYYKALSLIFLTFISQVGFAATPKIVCGGEPGTAAFEIDYVGPAGRGYYLYHHVLRDSRILAHFEDMGALYSNELNESQELIGGGTVYGQASIGSVDIIV